MFLSKTDGFLIPFSDRVHGKRLVTSGTLMMVEITYEEHGVAEMHVHHDNESITYVQEGELEVQVGDETRVLHAGDSFYVPKGTPHRAYARTKVITIDVFTPIRSELL